MTTLWEPVHNGPAPIFCRLGGNFPGQTESSEQQRPFWVQSAAVELRGRILAFAEVDPTSFAEQLTPLVDQRDQSTKQDAARYHQAIGDAGSAQKIDRSACRHAFLVVE